MIGDALEHVAQIEFWIKPAELGRAEQRADSRSTFTVCIGASEEISFAAKRDGAQSSFRG
jgi:hypothetical protein